MYNKNSTNDDNAAKCGRETQTRENFARRRRSTPFELNYVHKAWEAHFKRRTDQWMNGGRMDTDGRTAFTGLSLYSFRRLLYVLIVVQGPRQSRMDHHRVGPLDNHGFLSRAIFLDELSDTDTWECTGMVNGISVSGNLKIAGYLLCSVFSKWMMHRCCSE